MKKLNRLTVEFIGICNQIDDLYAQKRALEKEMKIEYEKLKETLRTTGKTIDNFEEV